MAYTDLLDFIKALDKHGELKRISIEVDPVLEIAEFADRSVKSHGPAFLFEKPNGGCYRMQIYDERTAGMHWQTHKQGAEQYGRQKAGPGARMDGGVAIGADPAAMYSALLPLPPDLEEMLSSGFIRGKPVEM